jgi:hypothetical protein
MYAARTKLKFSINKYKTMWQGIQIHQDLHAGKVDLVIDPGVKYESQLKF